MSLLFARYGGCCRSHRAQFFPPAYVLPTPVAGVGMRRPQSASAAAPPAQRAIARCRCALSLSPCPPALLSPAPAA